MTTQDKDKALEDYLAGDSEISSLYHEADAEQPPAALDAAILAAARKATGSRPHPSTSPFSGNNWILPSSVAALLVITVGLVHLMEEQTAPLPSAFEGPTSNGAAIIAEKLAAEAPAEPESLAEADAMVAAPDISAPASSPVPAKPVARDKPQAAISIAAKQATVEEQRRDQLAQAKASDDRLRKSIEKKEQFALQKHKDDVPAPGRLTMADRIASVSGAAASRQADMQPQPTEWLRQISLLRESGDALAAKQALDDFIAFYFPEQPTLENADNGFVQRADELAFDEKIAQQFIDELAAQDRLAESLKFRARLGLGTPSGAEE